ncbi:MAG: S41 family peptidase, partial [bacterium]
MKTVKHLLVFAIIVLIIAASPDSSSAAELIHGMRFPELSPDGSRLIFSYQGDLWTVNSNGGVASRITVNEAYEGVSRFSKDGSKIAFMSTRFGNWDIFVMPSDGSSEAKRVTYSSLNQLLYDWHPDGKRVLFSTPMRMFVYNMARQDIDGGMSIPIFEDHHSHSWLNITKDGKTIYYIREAGGIEVERTGYRGSGDGDIWSYDIETGEHKEILADNRSQHYLRLGHDESYLLFVDYVEQGSSNLARLDLETGELSYLTNYDDDTVRNITVDKNGTIVYEYMNDLWRMEPGKNPERLQITASAENKENEKERQILTEGMTGGDISHDGKLVAVEIQGDIFGFRVDGEVDNKCVSLTDTSGTLESNPVFSKDHKFAFFLANSGYGNSLVKMNLESKETEELISDSIIHNLQRVPTTDLLSFIEGNKKIVVFNPEDKSSDVIAEKICYVCGWASDLIWSPDGKYLALMDVSQWRDEIYIVDRETKESWNVTNYFQADSDPKFSPDGRWFSFGTYDEFGSDVILVELNPKADIKTTNLIDEDEEEAEEKESEEKSDEKSDKKDIEEDIVVIINFDRFDERGRVLSFTPGYNKPLGFSLDGEWLYYSSEQRTSDGNPISKELWKVPTDEDSDDPPSNLGQVPDKLIFTKESIFAVMNGKLFNFNEDGVGEEIPFEVQRHVDKNEETKLVMKLAGQYLEESFYDENMHGADWDRVRQKYLAMVDDARTPEDVKSLMRRLNGELNASHLGAYSLSSFKGQANQTAFLGLEWDFTHVGAGLKVKRVMTDGPADKPDIEIDTGDIVLQINEIQIDISHNPDEFLNLKEGEVFTLTIKGDPENRKVKIRAANPGVEYLSNYRTWVEEKRNLVKELSGDRLGYLHIEWMGPAQLALFEKEFYNLTKEKEGVIIDVRFNPGGDISEQLIDILDRRKFGYTLERGWDDYIAQPLTYSRVPTVVLINESSYSDAELFPAAYKGLN